MTPWDTWPPLDPCDTPNTPLDPLGHLYPLDPPGYPWRPLWPPETPWKTLATALTPWYTPDFPLNTFDPLDSPWPPHLDTPDVPLDPLGHPLRSLDPLVHPRRPTHPQWLSSNQGRERACMIQRNTNVLKNKLRNALCKIYFPSFARDKWSDHYSENCSEIRRVTRIRKMWVQSQILRQWLEIGVLQSSKTTFAFCKTRLPDFARD